jgi:hypothetical protein
MTNQPQPPGSLLRWVLTGALIGAVFTAPDGAILGPLLDNTPGLSVLEKVLRWAVYFAAGGAALGAIIGGIARVLAPRLVLKPPDEEGADEQ